MTSDSRPSAGPVGEPQQVAPSAKRVGRRAVTSIAGSSPTHLCGDHLADGGRELEAVAAPRQREVEPLDARCLTDDRVPVGRVVVGAGPAALPRGAGERGVALAQCDAGWPPRSRATPRARSRRPTSSGSSPKYVTAQKSAPRSGRTTTFVTASEQTTFGRGAPAGWRSTATWTRLSAIGTSTPAGTSSSRAQAPVASTTRSQAMSPSGVRTPAMRPPSDEEARWLRSRGALPVRRRSPRRTSSGSSCAHRRSRRRARRPRPRCPRAPAAARSRRSRPGATKDVSSPSAFEPRDVLAAGVASDCGTGSR